jgi:hypothetical protein
MTDGSSEDDFPRAEPWLRRSVLGLIAAGAGGAAAHRSQSADSPPNGGVALRDVDRAAGRAARGAINRTLEARLEDLPLTPEDFGASGNDEADDGQAFMATIDEALRRRNATIWLGAGRSYRIARTLPIRQGIAIVGPGSQGSADRFGCSIRHHADGDLFVWNGAGEAFAGTGGGLRDLLIVKADNHRGGAAIRIVATDDDHRPGEMILSNVLVYGIGSTAGARGNGGLWATGLVVDGTACNRPGARGVRSLYGFKLRFADCTSGGETVVINQVTHAFFFGLQIDQADAAAAPGLTIRGINENLNFYGVDIAGTITIVANDAGNATTDLRIDGKLGGAFANNDALATGNVTLSMSTSGGIVLVNKSPLLSMRTNLNPRFQLSLVNPTANDKTGDGTIHRVTFDTERYDRGNNFAPPANTYVCHCAGPHRFRAQVMLAGVGRGHTHAGISLARVGSEPTVVEKIFPVTSAAGGKVSLDIAADLILAYGDQVAVQVYAAGGPRTVGIHGAATLFTIFEGEYVG